MIRRAVLVAILGLMPTTQTHATTRHSPIAQRWGPAVLGGTLADWKHRYGPPLVVAAGSVYDWRLCRDKRWGQVVVTFLGNRAVAILGQGCAQVPLSMYLRIAFAHIYMPHDAVAHGRIAATDVFGGRITDQLFISRWLAQVLPRDQFSDCNQNPVKAGIVTVNLHEADNTGMQMGPGSCA